MVVSMLSAGMPLANHAVNLHGAFCREHLAVTGSVVGFNPVRKRPWYTLVD